MQMGGRRATFKHMQLPRSSPTPERLTQFAFAFAPPLLLQTAVELPIFDFLDQSPMSLEELCSRTGASHRGMGALLNAVVGFARSSGSFAADSGNETVVDPSTEFAGCENLRRAWIHT
jgi:Dimerisation domain